VCMCLCKCTMLSCLSVLLIMLNPRDDTLNPPCQPGPLQQHSGKQLGLALAHSLHTHAPAHARTHTHLSGNTKAGHKEKKAFLLGKKSKQLSHICICVCEHVSEEGERELGKQRKRETHTHTHTHTHTQTHISDTKKEEIKQHFLCLEIQHCHKAMIETDYREAYTDH